MDERQRQDDLWQFIQTMEFVNRHVVDVSQEGVMIALLPVRTASGQEKVIEVEIHELQAYRRRNTG